ncbi:MAG: lipopolysaccharide biosynthesis protein [Alistipes sp.]|nr:lipopolysaccharide biosynthesis protein [Alistipes sp.]
MAENSTRHNFTKGLSSQTLITIIMGVLEIGVFAVMSRLLTPEEFGYYAIILAIINIFQCLTEAGLGSAVIQRSKASEEFISTALGLSTLLGAFFSLILIVTAEPLSVLMGYDEELTVPLRCMSITVLLCSVNSVARGIFMTALDFMKYGWCQIAAYLLSSGIGITLAVAGYGVNAIIVSTITNTVLMTIILFAVRGVRPRLTIHRHYTREILSYGGWLTGSVIVRQITTELDKLMLTYWIPVAQIGAYNRPSGFISKIVDRINGIFDTVLFPFLSALKDDRAKVQTSMLTATALVSWFSMILTFGFALSAQIIIDIFFGSEWDWLVDIFRILSLTIPFLSMSRIGDCFFRSLGIVKAYFYVRLTVCIVTLGCIFAGCHYGITGVAIGVLVSRVADSLIKYGYLITHLNIRWYSILNSIVAPTWITIALAAICYVISRQIPLGDYIGIAIFIAVGMSMLIFTPKLFGRDYCNNIHSVAKQKLLAIRNKRMQSPQPQQ